jgi:hypothetical protein
LVGFLGNQPIPIPIKPRKTGYPTLLWGVWVWVGLPSFSGFYGYGYGLVYPVFPGFMGFMGMGMGWVPENPTKPETMWVFLSDPECCS